MSVDVIIPLYNGSKWIRDTLKSVFNQSLKPSKVIVVDDGSIDDSYKVVSEFNNVILLKNREKGVVAARNLGLAHTTAEFVAFLDQDDLWHPKHLRILSESLLKNTDVACVASELKPFVDGAYPNYDLSDNTTELFDPWEKYPMHGFACSPSLSLFRRADIIAIGGWPAEHEGMSDYSLWLKLSINKPILRLKKKTVAYRLHAHSQTVAISKKDPSYYINLCLKVDDDLKSFYLKAKKNSDAKLLERHNYIGHQLVKLLEVFNSYNKNELKLILDDVENNIKLENIEYRKAFFRHFYALLENQYYKDSYDKIDYILIELLDKWLINNPFLKEALIEVIAMIRPKIIIKQIARKPWKFDRLVNLIILFKIKFRGVIVRLKRIKSR